MEKMSQVLLKQEMKRLLIEVLMKFGNEHLMGKQPEVYKDAEGVHQLKYLDADSVYCLETENGKLLEEIYNFLNKRAVMHSQKN